MIETIIIKDGVEIARDTGKCVLAVVIKDSIEDEHHILEVYGNATAYESTLAACALSGYVADRVAPRN